VIRSILIAVAIIDLALLHGIAIHMMESGSRSDVSVILRGD
jgi:hypothetical protein